jgi:hypothetical protein
MRDAATATAGPRSCNGCWPTPVNYAGQPNRLRCTMCAPSRTSIPRAVSIHRSGSHGWPPAAARPWLSAANATRTSTLDVPRGAHDEHWRAGCHGNRARPVRRGPSEKALPTQGSRRRPTRPHGGFDERPGETDHRQRWHRAQADSTVLCPIWTTVNWSSFVRKGEQPPWIVPDGL